MTNAPSLRQAGIPHDIEAEFDVAVIGMGPTGLTLAAKLARLGRRVLIVEKHPKFYGDPRAGGIDHEIVRFLYTIDAAGPTMEIAVPVTSYAWYNKDRELLLNFIEPGLSVSGCHHAYMQFQPVLEKALVDRIKSDASTCFLQGWELVDFDQDGSGVDLVLRSASQVGSPEQFRRFRAAYLVGADGSNSFVRRTLGIDRLDLGFNETWLDIDVRIKRPFHIETPMAQICDPARPRVILPLGKHHHRWEWAVRDDESADEMLAPETAWKLLADEGVGPDDVEIIRHILYTFTAFMATQWRDGRILLAGDSAHTQPPFQGQGMNSGVRDSVNLAWKLDMVLGGLADDALLDSYQAERYGHTRDWTIISIMSGEVSCVSDPVKAAKRDALFRSGFVPPMPEKPYLKGGMLDVDGTQARGLVGRLALNARVDKGGNVDLFDNFFYRHNFIVIAWDHDPVLDDDARRILDRIGAQLVSLGGSGCSAGDADGSYAALFAEHGIDVLIMRPDFYVFGGCAADGLSDLVRKLEQRLHRPAAAVEETDALVISTAEAWA